MRSTSVRELHIHTSALVQEASEGGTIVIERRGQPVAELRPISSPPSLTSAEKKKIFDRLEKLWANQKPTGLDSTLLVEQDRDR